MTIRRCYHTASLLFNGKVLVTGGLTNYSYAQATQTSEIYDPATGTWTPTSTMNEGRSYHTASVLMNGHVLVAGGYYNCLTAELYDPLRQTWTMTGNMSYGRERPTASILPNGKVVVVGVANYRMSEMYDPSSGQWSLSGNTLQTVVWHTSSTLSNGRLLIAGGSNNNAAVNTAELF